MDSHCPSEFWWGDQDASLQTQFLTLSHEKLMYFFSLPWILLYFPWQFVFATRGIHCLHAECRVEFGIGMCMHPCIHIHQDLFFSQLCLSVLPSSICWGNVVIYKSFRNPTAFMPNWIISFCTLCQFLEINNRPFQFSLWSHQLSHGIFPDVSVLGCYYKKA